MHNKISFWLCFLFVLCASNSLFAQKTEEQLAGQYASAGEFRKAADLYEKLLSSNPSSVFLYDNLLSCYLRLKDEDAANKLIKKQIRRYEGVFGYKVDQAWVYEQFNKPERAIELQEQLLQKLSPPGITELAFAFQKRKQLKLAVKTYLRGRELLRNNLAFAAELGGIYADLGLTKETVEEYLNVLIIDETKQDEIQGIFQGYLRDNSEYELCKMALLKRAKVYGDKLVFQEMLQWLFVQKNDYQSALPFARQMDKRLKAEGRSLIDLAYLAMANAKYDDALVILKEVQLLGVNKPYFSLARQVALDARAKKLLAGSYTIQDLQILESEYLATLLEFGENESSAQTMRDLAFLQAYYLAKSDQAVALLAKLISMTRLDRGFIAQCKLELGDVYLSKGEVWESLLLYGQVDKDFKEEPLGQEARFRNARLSFYMGEFEWAKAQLDILKTATTQLIANNAMELSLLIQENMLDSNSEPLRLFASASLFLERHMYQMAQLKLDSIDKLYANHALSDDILFKRAEIEEAKGQFQQAVSYLDLVVKKHGSDILADNALFKMAEIVQHKLGDANRAASLYERLIVEYSGSFFVPEARRRYRILKGDLPNSPNQEQ